MLPDVELPVAPCATRGNGMRTCKGILLAFLVYVPATILSGGGAGASSQLAELPTKRGRWSTRIGNASAAKKGMTRKRRWLLEVLRADAWSMRT